MQSSLCGYQLGDVIKSLIKTIKNEVIRHGKNAAIRVKLVKSLFQEVGTFSQHSIKAVNDGSLTTYFIRFYDVQGANLIVERLISYINKRRNA